VKTATTQLALSTFKPRGSHELQVFGCPLKQRNGLFGSWQDPARLWTNI